MNIIKFNNSILKYDGKWLETDGTPTPTPPHPDYNPLNLPPNTFRVRTSDGDVPYRSSTTSYDTATLVPGTSNVYDVYKSGTSLSGIFLRASNVVEVLGANTSGATSMDYLFYECYYLTSVPLFDTTSVTSMRSMFTDCQSLTSVPLYDTSNVTRMDDMFYDCETLTSIPLFNTSSVTNMNSMFLNCVAVETGSLALYQQASTQSTPPTNHARTFYGCGANTTTGAAELAQIPSDWKSW